MAKPPTTPPSPEKACTGLRIAGVLGGIGSGKSTAAALLSEGLSATHFDADLEVSKLLASAELAAEVQAELGDGLCSPDGLLMRSALAQRIFRDAAARKALEAILHPAVRANLYRSLQLVEATPPHWAVLDVPLLLENGLHALCDLLIFVDVPAELRKKRACARHGWSAADWQARESTQRPMNEKKSVAHAILDNAGGVELLRKQVESLLPTLLALHPRSLRDRWPSLNTPPLGRSNS
jgi:dephospho-CoA kinase